MPLAYTLQPKNLTEFIGQENIVGKNGLITKMIESKNIFSMIFWGPPSTGKTSLAEIIANQTNADFVRISAVMDGKDELRKVVDLASKNELFEQKTILFIDEIHRWNKAQQDALLPFVESGKIILIGATTENPSYEIVSALLSRTRVIVFKKHTAQDIFIALCRGLYFLQNQTRFVPKNQLDIPEEFKFIQAKNPEKNSEKNTEKSSKKNPEKLKNPLKSKQNLQLKSLQMLANIADGDMRFALNTLEMIYQIDPGISEENLQKTIQKKINYDKNGEEHYNIISAVHKSLRSSNPTAAVYWICRMLEGGEDPIYIARRLVRFASEDIGNSSPTALFLANAVFDTCKNLGMPECGVALVQLAQYLALAPKNNAAYTAYNLAMQDIKKHGNLAVPLHLRNANSKLMSEIGYGKGYEYDHDLPNKKSSQNLLPDELKGRDYFDKN